MEGFGHLKFPAKHEIKYFNKTNEDESHKEKCCLKRGPQTISQAFQCATCLAKIKANAYTTMVLSAVQSVQPCSAYARTVMAPSAMNKLSFHRFKGLEFLGHCKLKIFLVNI